MFQKIQRAFLFILIFSGVGAILAALYGMYILSFICATWFVLMLGLYLLLVSQRVKHWLINLVVRRFTKQFDKL